MRKKYDNIMFNFHHTNYIQKIIYIYGWEEVGCREIHTNVSKPRSIDQVSNVKCQVFLYQLTH